MKKNTAGNIIFAIISSVFLIVLDQITKLVAVAHLKGQNSFVLIPDVFELHYLENRGAAFGILQGQKWLFVVCTTLFVLVLCFLYLRTPPTKKFFFLRIVMVLFLSGAIGNFIDRMRQNYVVDFFYFSLIDFPIFNVADIYVTVGAAALILLILFYYKEEDLNEILPGKTK